jgi:cation-transporting ATPase 13A3/4/5
MITTIFISSYMLFDPAVWLFNLMELTQMSEGFKVFLLFLGLGGFAIGYVGEIWTFPRLAKAIEQWKKSLLKRQKKRKEYKVILEESARSS